jgi:hypothetical protein
MIGLEAQPQVLNQSHFRFPHLALAAFLADSERALGSIFLALAFPPALAKSFTVFSFLGMIQYAYRHA